MLQNNLGVFRTVPVNTMRASRRESIPVTEYVRQEFVPISYLAHNWEMYTAVPLSPSEERTMVREPAHAVPASLASRLSKLRVLLVPYVACLESGDVVAFTKPEGETHSAVWVEGDGHVDLVLACRELDPHDTGFEFLASVAELARTKLTGEELSRFTEVLEDELKQGVQGDIDEEAAAAKQQALKNRGTLRRRGREELERYRDVAFVSTLAEYMHGLWHDVQIRVGPEHLPLPQLRRRMDLLTAIFPPNPGYKVFAEGLQETE